jgi:hypothetical protein
VRVPKKQAKSRKPLTISIHGEGIDIDAKISNRNEFGDVASAIAERLATRLNGGSPGPTVAPVHDFDRVKIVIEHGDPVVLQAIIDLAAAKLEQHRTVS